MHMCCSARPDRKGTDGGLVLLLQALKAEAENQVELARGAVESGARQSTACVVCSHCLCAAALVHVFLPVWCCPGSFATLEQNGVGQEESRCWMVLSLGRVPVPPPQKCPSQ